MFADQSARSIPERFADGMDAAFALNRFQDHRADGIVELRFEVADIVELHKIDAGHERGEWKAVFFSRSSAYRAKCTPVKRVRHCQDAMFFCRRVRCFVGGASIKPRELQRAFNRFGAAVREKDVIHSRPLRKFFRERPLKWMVVKVGEMNRARYFPAE